MTNMTSMKAGSSLYALAAATALMVAPMAAPAATVTVLGASVQNGDCSVVAMPGPLTCNQADQFAGTYNASLPGGTEWVIAPTVITPPPGSVSKEFKSPFIDTMLEDTQTYFSVSKKTEPTLATLGFTEVRNSLTFLWGSIDSFNSVVFRLVGGDTYTFGGGDVIGTVNAFLGEPEQTGTGSFERVALLRFSFEDAISEVDFRSNTASFEFAMIPLPAAGWLLLGGLGALGAVARRKRRKAA